VVDLGDVRVVELAHERGLDHEAGLRHVVAVRILEHARVENLDGDVDVAEGIEGLEDVARRAPAQPALDLELPQAFGGVAFRRIHRAIVKPQEPRRRINVSMRSSPEPFTRCVRRSTASSGLAEGTPPRRKTSAMARWTGSDFERVKRATSSSWISRSDTCRRASVSRARTCAAGVLMPTMPRATSRSSFSSWMGRWRR